MDLNYQLVCHSNLLKDLPKRNEEVIVRRFGLDHPGRVEGEKETLESIGRTYGITRERVRQIEEQGMHELAERVDTPLCRNAFQYFSQHLKAAGSLQREDILLSQLGGEKFQNHVFFLLTLGKSFYRFPETEKLYSFWTIDKNSLNAAQKAVHSFYQELKKKKQSLPMPVSVPPSYIEISKEILKGPQGLYGLKDWPEVNPRGIKDKAYLVFKEEEKPLHFTEVATLINHSPLFNPPKTVISQTVHNELIKDQRFVLIGRGLYALKEWGYAPGVVKEVIAKTLKEAKRPLAREEVVEKVLQQRQVKPNTILLNLQNKKYFLKNSQGKYFIRKA